MGEGVLKECKFEKEQETVKVPRLTSVKVLDPPSTGSFIERLSLSL
jgi:hypothetical protein